MSQMIELPWRQVHMDFHTSEHIEDVARDFDAEEFADTLARAHVEQVCCFARCHHGMIYYDSKRNPERVHPHLARRNLLIEQIEACHKRGIRVPIYTSVQWDYYTVQRFPQWACVAPDGGVVGTKPLDGAFYRRLCVNSGYREWLKGHVTEIFEVMPAVDGMFFDIVMTEECICPACRDGMKKAGLDILKESDRLKYAYDVLCDFMLDMSEHVRSHSKDATIYYNSGKIAPNRTKPLAAFTHLEFDALPSSNKDGYRTLRDRGRFERNLGLQCVAHTGKFQTIWGDFHSFKNTASLEYECFQAMSLNCKCLVGDQLVPKGRLEPEVYSLIGGVFEQVKAKEPWCRGAKAAVDIGVLCGEKESRRGASGLLLEGAHQFDMIDNGMDFSRYKVLVVPDDVACDEELAKKLDEYVAAGGRVLASFEGGMDAEGEKFLPVSWPVECTGPGPMRDGKRMRGVEMHRHDFADYIVPAGRIGEGLATTEHVMYQKGVQVAAKDGAEVLADVTESYFDRSLEYFCSHKQTPSSGRKGYPAIVQSAGGGVIYFGHPVFTLYSLYGPLWIKKMTLNALDMLLSADERLLRHGGPSTLEATVNEQDKEGRRVVHLLHYVPVGRARRLDVVEEAIPLYDVRVSLRADGPVAAVRCVPGGEELAFEVKRGRCEFVAAKIDGHQMIEVTR